MRPGAGVLPLADTREPPPPCLFNFVPNGTKLGGSMVYAGRGQRHRVNRGNKYHARRVELDGYTFDSKREASRYGELRLLEHAGRIRELQVHPKYELVPAFTHPIQGGQRAITYTADFQYEELVQEDRLSARGTPVLAARWQVVVEDVKSSATRTRDYRLRRRLFLLRNPDKDHREVM